MKKIVIRLMLCLVVTASCPVLFSSCDKCGTEEWYELEVTDENGEVHLIKEKGCV